MSKIEIPKDIQEAAIRLYPNAHRSNLNEFIGKKHYIKGALAERAKAEELAFKFAEWAAINGWAYQPDYKEWFQTYNGLKTTSQLFTLYQNDKMK